MAEIPQVRHRSNAPVSFSLVAPIFTELRKVVDYDRASIMLLMGDRLEVLAASGLTKSFKEQSFKLSELKGARYAIENKTAVVISDTQRDDRWDANVGDEPITRSWVGIPLISQDRVIGLFSLDKLEAHFYDQADLNLVSAFARQAAIAIENARLYHEAQQSIRGLSAIQEISVKLTGELELQAVLDTIASSALELLDATNVHIFLYDESTDSFEFGASHRATEVEAQPTGAVRRDGAIAAVAHSKEPLIIEDTAEHPLFTAEEIEEWALRSIALFPLKHGAYVVGVLNIAFAFRQAFGADKLLSLELLANQAAIAINNARLFERQSRLAQKLLGLHTLSQSINLMLDIDQVLLELIEQVHSIFGYDFIAIFLLDEWTNELYVAAQLGYAQDKLPLSGRMRVGLDGICGYVAAAGEMTVVPDVQQAPFYLEAHPDIKSELAIPLTVRGRIIGVFNVESTRPSAFKEDDITLLSALAGQMAVALENARLYQQTQQQVEELAQEAARLRVVNHISNLINSTLDLQQIVQTLVDQLAELTEADQCRLIILEHESGYGRVWAEYVPTEDNEELLPIKGNPYIDLLMERKEPVVIHDTSTDSRLGSVRGSLIAQGVKSMVILPLLAKDQVIGSLSIDLVKGQRLFSRREVDTCQIIANQAAVAIENARLFQERERRIAELAVLNDVGRAISSIMSLGELLEMIREQASRVVDTTNLYIALYDSLTNLIEFPLYYEHGKPHYTPPREFSHSLIEHIIIHRSPMLIRGDTREFCRSQDIEYNDLPAKSWLGVPLVAGDRVLGAMVIRDHDRSDVYDDDHLRVLSTLAAQAAIAIENARLYEKEHRRATQLAVINKVGRQITSILDQQELLSQVSRLLRQVLGYSKVYISLIDGDDLVFHDWEDPRGKPQELLRLRVGQEGITGWVASTGELLIVPDVRREPRYRPLDAKARTLSEIALPLKVGDKILGVLDVESEQPAAFSEEDATILHSLASQIAVALSNAQLYQESVTRVEQELSIARQIQQKLFPQSLPEIPGLEIAAICWPAKETGGDFYEFLELGKGRLGIIVGDVSGKSIPAAMLMAVARSTARSEGRDHLSPACVLGETNRLLYDDVPEGAFVAMSYAVVDTTTGRLTLSNGGQLSPLWCAGDGWRYLETPGNRLPLGIRKDNDYQEAEVELTPGDCLVFYTDGLVEAMNQRRELYGFPRLERLLTANSGQVVHSLLDTILKDVSSFGGESGLHDDLTLVIARWQGRQDKSPKSKF